MVVQPCQMHFQFPRVPRVIGVNESDPFAACRFPAGITSAARADIVLEGDDLDPARGIACINRLQLLESAITARVVYEQHLERGTGLRGNGCDRPSYRVGTAPARNDNA